ncbi:DUF6320 domain-containing protein [Haploplasma modicum]|uniref:DUF6320 domain-containing protein n=1 Tax=Haploplasma modicum TaxID=2150 RepID=UPI00047EB45C|nr:DUF6320 domain-containing protein [Haploplasma modicum]
MKYCENCKINYEKDFKKCLLCGDDLISNETDLTVNSYPTIKKTKEPLNIIYRTFILLNIISIIVSIFIDYNADKNLSWSLIVSSGNISTLLFLKLLFSESKLVLRIISFLFISLIELIIIGYLSKDPSWAIDIVLPLGSSIITIFLTVVIFSKSKRWQDYAISLIISCIINISLILLNIFNVTVTKWPVLVAFFIGLSTLLLLILFAPKKLKEELLRRFHI